MNQPRSDLRVHRSHRKETVGDRPKRLAQPMTIGEPREADGRYRGPRLLRGDEALDRLPERRLQRRPCPSLPLEPLEVVVAWTDGLAQQALGVLLRLARQQPAVADQVAEGRDH